ncbi:hypothetical protein J4558_05405 [Leptolyngbya sp. 15MV]|nr:hypothetical protein J4558_05405 [Leptolyngbya sp. 15MV]
MALGIFDTTTRANALRAARVGAIGAALLALATTLAGYASAAQLDLAALEGQIGMALVALQIVACLIAALRLWQGKGAWWGTAVALLVTMEIVTKIAMMTALPGLAVNFAFLRRSAR